MVCHAQAVQGRDERLLRLRGDSAPSAVELLRAAGGEVVDVHGDLVAMPPIQLHLPPGSQETPVTVTVYCPGAVEALA